MSEPLSARISSENRTTPDAMPNQRFVLDVERDRPSPVMAFRQGMLSIARDGSYLEIVTSIFAAEWMYASRCRGAHACAITDPPPAERVASHARDGPSRQAARSKAELGRVQALEIACRDAPYRDIDDRGQG